MGEKTDIYYYMHWGNYNKRIKDLAGMALDEIWSFPEDQNNTYSILKNYMKYTFYKLQEENKIVETQDYCVFNTGLFTKYYEPICVYGEKSPNPDGGWKFKDFYTSYELGSVGIGECPERADYFSDPGLLIFDWHCKINVNIKHILEDADNKTRLPVSVLNADRPEYILQGAVNNAIQRVTANYKLAVPQYFAGKVQLLLPLCFDKSDTPQLAIALTKMDGGYYQGHTCLTMDMAYNNARLISKPENNWLSLDRID